MSDGTGRSKNHECVEAVDSLSARRFTPNRLGRSAPLLVLTGALLGYACVLIAISLTSLVREYPRDSSLILISTVPILAVWIVAGLAASTAFVTRTCEVRSDSLRMTGLFRRARVLRWDEVRLVRTVYFGRIRDVGARIVPYDLAQAGRPISIRWNVLTAGTDAFDLLLAMAATPVASKFDLGIRTVCQLYEEARSSPPAEPGPEGPDPLGAARQALASGDLMKADKILHAHFKSTGEVPDDFVRLRYVLLREGAAWLCRQALEHDEHDDVARYYLANTFPAPVRPAQGKSPRPMSDVQRRLQTEARGHWQLLAASDRYGEEARERLGEIDVVLR